MPKKKTALTIEERLQQALVPAEEQPYEVPENWVWVRLENVCEHMKAGGDKPKDFSVEKVEGKEIPVVANGIEDEGIIGYTSCSGELSGSLTVAGRGTIGYSFIRMYDFFPVVRLLVVRPYDFVNLKMLKYVFDAIPEKGKGSSIPQLTIPMIKEKAIPLPPLSEQQRIVERIEELFAKLDEAKERLQEVADSFAVRKAAILHKAFTGELTKQWRRENGVSDKSWEEKKGEDFFEYVTSGSRGWAKYYSDKGSIFVRMGNLNHGTIELDFSDIQYVELPDQVEGQRSKLQKNDILISITADVGMIGLVREDMDAYINQHVALARPKNDVYAEFLAWYFVSDVGLQQMQNKQRGATKIGLGLQDIRSIILKIPTIPEQHEIVRLIDDLLARERSAQQATEQALASIDLMKKSILARAFRGELGTNKASEASALELLRQVLAEN